MFHHAFNLLYKPIGLLYVNKVNCILLSKKKKKSTNLKAYFFFPINQAIYPIYSLSSILAFEVFFLGKFY